MEPVRLQKHLARAGIASRRGAESIIEAGRVTVNGQVVRELGTRVDPDNDTVEVDGQAVVVQPSAWIVLNKPRGYVCTRSDPQGRRTVYDLIPPEFNSLFTVGRLDTDSEGLLLFTNEGDAAQLLLHPRYGVEREYAAIVTGRPTAGTLESLRRGVRLEDGMARATSVTHISDTSGGARLRLVLKEGRKREIRRMLAAVGHPVSELRRVRYGPLSLGELHVGTWRRLDDREVRSLSASREPTGKSNRTGRRPDGDRNR